MAQNEIELKPCPFCGGPAEMRTIPGVRSVLRCANSQCYLYFNPWYSFNCGDTDEHARLRLSTWWNMRTTQKRESDCDSCGTKTCNARSASVVRINCPLWRHGPQKANKTDGERKPR